MDSPLSCKNKNQSRLAAISPTIKIPNIAPIKNPIPDAIHISIVTAQPSKNLIDVVVSACLSELSDVKATGASITSKTDN